jgi:hypothetical protein
MLRRAQDGNQPHGNPSGKSQPGSWRAGDSARILRREDVSPLSHLARQGERQEVFQADYRRICAQRLRLHTTQSSACAARAFGHRRRFAGKTKCNGRSWFERQLNAGRHLL